MSLTEHNLLLDRIKKAVEQNPTVHTTLLVGLFEHDNNLGSVAQVLFKDPQKEKAYLAKNPEMFGHLASQVFEFLIKVGMQNLSLPPYAIEGALSAMLKEAADVVEEELAYAADSDEFTTPKTLDEDNEN